MEVLGLDIWDPINNRLAARSVEDIVYRMLDDAGFSFLCAAGVFLRRREGRTRVLDLQ